MTIYGPTVNHILAEGHGLVTILYNRYKNVFLLYSIGYRENYQVMSIVIRN